MKFYSKTKKYYLYMLKIVSLVIAGIVFYTCIFIFGGNYAIGGNPIYPGIEGVQPIDIIILTVVPLSFLIYYLLDIFGSGVTLKDDHLLIRRLLIKKELRYEDIYYIYSTGENDFNSYVFFIYDKDGKEYCLYKDKDFKLIVQLKCRCLNLKSKEELVKLGYNIRLNDEDILLGSEELKTPSTPVKYRSKFHFHTFTLFLILFIEFILFTIPLSILNYLGEEYEKAISIANIVILVLAPATLVIFTLYHVCIYYNKYIIFDKKGFTYKNGYRKITYAYKDIKSVVKETSFYHESFNIMVEPIKGKVFKVREAKEDCIYKLLKAYCPNVNK